MLSIEDFDDEAGGPSGAASRRWSQGEDALAATANKLNGSSVDDMATKCNNKATKKGSPQIGNLANLTESEVSRAEHGGGTST